MKHTLIVDADVNAATSLKLLVASEKLTVSVAHTLRDARRQTAMQRPDVLMLDPQLPDGCGSDLLDDPQLQANCEIVLTTSHAKLETSIRALVPGAAEYLVKPIDKRQLQSVLSRVSRPTGLMREVAQVPSSDQSGSGCESARFGHLWGRAPAMQRVYDQILRVAATSVNVFITGESGTGKELVAQTLHELSRRCKQPFLAVNCGAISPSLIESELFGHEKGSFTGADRLHQGFFERASGGTLFLDEISEMSQELQVKLLRVLETGRFMRVGSTEGQQADLRVIAASNRAPLQAVATGKLREDLMYRLNVFPIDLPPLRDRMDDVPLLAAHFLAEIAAQEGQARVFTARALDRLAQWRWPGNVRELRNAVQRAYVMAAGDAIDDEWLPCAAPMPDSPTSGEARVVEPGTVRDRNGGTLTFQIGTPMEQIERATLLATLEHFQQHRERTAAVLGISLKTLYNRIRAYAGEECAGAFASSPQRNGFELMN